MPTKKFLQRPQTSHAVGDRAAKQISDVCEEHGWAVQIVQRDYGEDLLIQPVGSDDAVEHFRLWIQSKGTSDLSTHQLKNGNYSYSVSFAHAYKWLRSADLCMVVLWDTNKKEGVYSVPSDCIDEEWLYTKEPKSVTLNFAKENKFNGNELAKIAWRCRLHHYSTLLSSAKSEINASGDGLGLLWSRVLDLLKALSVFESDPDLGLRINSDFLACTQAAFYRLSQEEPYGEATVQLREAMMLALVIRFEDKTGLLGVPAFVASTCEEFISSALPALRKHGII